MAVNILCTVARGEGGLLLRRVVVVDKIQVNSLGLFSLFAWPYILNDSVWFYVLMVCALGLCVVVRAHTLCLGRGYMVCAQVAINIVQWRKSLLRDIGLQPMRLITCIAPQQSHVDDVIPQ